MKKIKNSSITFDQIYNQLNEKQKLAVNTIEGPVMVIAGPGTGKTQVLAARIANILIKTDANPQNILALTFTDSAAKNMKERVVSMIGPTGYKVRITTFHGFCNDLILQYPEYFAIPRDSTPLSELEKYQIFETILTELNLEVLKPINRPFFYLKDLIKAISDLKREGVAPSEFIEIVQGEYANLEEIKSKVERKKVEKIGRKNQELGLIYQVYQAKLIAQSRYDFDDMITMALASLSGDPDFLLEIQEKFQYVLVDEYQDTNSAQNKVVSKIMSYWGQKANLFVVGDPYQSIFRFQGASLENILVFVSQYKEAKVIQLADGYRCPQDFYNAAFCLMKNQTKPDLAETNFTKIIQYLEEKPLKTQAKNPNLPIEIIKAPSQLSEQLWLGQKIKSLLKADVQPEAIAVLARTNQELIDLAQVLERLEIKYELSAGGSILELEPIRQLLNFCRLIEDLRAGDPTDLMFEVMSYTWVGLPALTVMKLARLAGLKKVSVLEYLEQKTFNNSKDAHVLSLTPLDLEPIKNFIDSLYLFASADFNLTLPAWFENLINQSGFLSWIFQQPNKIELLIALNTLFREVKSLASVKKSAKLINLLESLNLLEDHGLRLKAEDLNIKKGAIELSTIHKAKGREWDQVFLMGLIDGRWGNTHQRQLLPLPQGLLQYATPSKTEQNDEDRRLLYVGLTRAKQALYLSYPETIINNGQSREVVQSSLLEELRTCSREEKSFKFSLNLIEATDQLPDLETQLTQLIQQPPSRLTKDYSASERAFFEHLVNNFSLSVSSFNKYLRDPHEFMLDVLLKVPKAKAAPMAFGTAVHSTLENFYKTFSQEKNPPNLAMLLKDFAMNLSNELLTPEDFKRRLSRGQEILTNYHQQVSPISPRIVELETFFGFGEHPTYLDDIHLTGRVDRIDFLESGQDLVKVIDYKTGKAKSHNAIAGLSETQGYSPRELALPEAIRGVYKRQLLFYKLLADLSPGFNYQVTTGEFEFVEPNQSGKITRQVFDLPKEEVELLKKLIKEVMVEIRGLAFLNFKKT